MRKIKLFLLSGAFAMSTAVAEASEAMNFGVKGGVSMSSLSGINTKQFGGNGDKVMSRSSICPAGGAFFSYAFHDYVGLGVEVKYANPSGKAEKKQEGKKTAGDKKEKNKDCYSISSTNVLLPVTLQVYPMGHDLESGILSIYLGAQPSIALGMKAKNAGEEDKDFKSEFKNLFTADAIVGMSYQLPMGVLIDIRAAYGFMNVLADGDEVKAYMAKRGFKKEKNSNAYSSLGNRSYSLSLGYSLASLMS